MQILKAAPGLDPANRLARLLGSEHRVIEYDENKPLAQQATDADVLILRDVPVTADVMDQAPKLKLLQRYGQHVSGVDFAHAAKKKIHVACVPAEANGSSRLVAEHALFLMFALAKRYREAQAQLAEGRIGGPLTVPLTGRTLALVGVGRTGTELASLAKGIGMRVIAVKQRSEPQLQSKLGLNFLGGPGDLSQVLGQADFVSIHLPLASSTVGFFGQDAFRAMKPGSFLVNIARGPIVDRGALLEALRSGGIAGAGIDVFWQEPPDPDDPLFKMDNVIATPHHAGASEDVHEQLAAIVAENIRKVAAGLPPDHIVSGSAQ